LKDKAMPIRLELQSVLDRYTAAYRRGDAAGCAAAFTPDGEMRSPYGPPAIGRTEVAATHEIWTAGGSDGKRLDVVQAGSSGDLAWCLADYSEGTEAGNGSSLMVFLRQGDGGWLIRICSLNESLAAEDGPST
jgi:uncharacterized protein (TIGR02246 family)